MEASAINVFVHLFDFRRFDHAVDFIPVLMITIFLWKSSSLFPMGYRLKKEILGAVAKLRTLNRNDGERPEIVMKYSDLFGVGWLNHLWHEFHESLIKVEENGQYKYRNTLDAEHFFTFNRVGQGFSFYSSVPGLLTGLAITGTFFGIIDGLYSANIMEAATSSALMDGVKKFTSGLSGAFTASLWGLALALLFSFLERSQIANIESALGDLTDEINRVFPRQTSEELLLRISVDSQNQLSSMNAMASNIGNSVVQALTEGAVSTIEISDSVKQGVKLGFEGLASALKGLNEFHEKYMIQMNTTYLSLRGVSETIGQVTVAQNAIAGTTNQASQSLHSAASSLEKANSSTASVVQSIDAQLSTFREVSSKLQMASEELRSSIGNYEPIHKNLSSQISEASQQFKANSSEFLLLIDKSSEKVSKDFNQVDDFLSSTVQKLGGAVALMTKHLDEIASTVSDLRIKQAESAAKLDDKNAS